MRNRLNQKTIIKLLNLFLMIQLHGLLNYYFDERIDYKLIYGYILPRHRYISQDIT